MSTYAKNLSDMQDMRSNQLAEGSKALQYVCRLLCVPTAYMFVQSLS